MPESAAPARIVPSSAFLVGETSEDHRKRLAQLQAEALERRQQELGEQRSPLHTPEERIRIWERLHQLRLPRNPSHRMVSVIAAQTNLSLEDVRAEQVLRAANSRDPKT
jgi:hypothetical protein